MIEQVAVRFVIKGAILGKQGGQGANVATDGIARQRALGIGFKLSFGAYVC